MLKPAKRVAATQTGLSRFVIVASRDNSRFVDGMLKGAEAVLAKVEGAEVRVVRVPGAFEIPVVAAKLASNTSRALSGVICLGVILRGQTTHAQFIGEAVTAALASIQIQYQVPVIHEVLLLENEEQASQRCLDPGHNRGAEAAHTALEMAELMRQLEGPAVQRRGRRGEAGV